MPVEITDLDPIAVGEGQVSDAKARQLDGNVGAQPASTGDTDTGGVQMLLAFLSVPFHQCC